MALDGVYRFHEGKAHFHYPWNGLGLYTLHTIFINETAHLKYLAPLDDESLVVLHLSSLI